MSTTQERTVTITIRVPVSMKKQLEDLAEATGRQRTYLATEALRRYLEVETWQVAKIKEGMRAAAAGEFATPEEIEAVFNRYRAYRTERADE